MYSYFLKVHKKLKLKTYLLGSETSHVGDLDDMLQELGEIRDIGVDSHLVLPLKLGPHLSELGVIAGSGHDVVHDVDVDVVEHHTVTVAACSTYVIH